MTEYRTLRKTTLDWLVSLLALADNHANNLRQTCTDKGVNNDAKPECNRWLDLWEHARNREVGI